MSEQFEQLKRSGNLPAPSGVGLRVLLLTRSEDCSLEDITRTLELDPQLAGWIVHFANAGSGTKRTPVSNVLQATERLGIRTVCRAALGFSLLTGNRSGPCAPFDYDRFWSWSLANAVAARLLSSELGMGVPGDAFTLGFLARIGRLALSNMRPEQYREVETSVREDASLDLASLERGIFRIQHRELGAALIEDWGLPELFSEVILCQEQRIPDELEWPESRDYLRLLAASSRMADVLLAASEDAGSIWPRVCESIYALGLDGEDSHRLLDAVGEVWAEWGSRLGIPAQFTLRAGEVERRSRSRRQAPQAGAEGANQPLRILLVDDDRVLLRKMRRILEREGHRVTVAENGRKALNIALKAPPQMVITDWNMPEMDGLELCKSLRRTDAGRKLYVLILTGEDQEERLYEAFDAGADDYLLKSMSSKLLLARIKPGQRVIGLQEQLLREMDEKVRANRQLQQQRREFEVASRTDALTDLLNRRGAMRLLGKEWAATERTQLPLSVILIDIDHFKRVNDEHGHDVGDEVLRATARAINGALRTSDTCTRLGGEEFLVICPNTPLVGAEQLAERVRAAIEANRVDFASFHGGITISLGISCHGKGAESVDALLKSADEAVYLAKRLGRNRVCSAPAADQDRRSA